MHRKLIIETFKKVKDEEEQSTGIRPSDTAAAKLLSDYIFESQKLTFGERRLADYLRMTKKQKNDKVIVKDPRVVQAMCNYLEYENFRNFKQEYGISDTEVSAKNTDRVGITNFFKKNKVAIIVSSIIIVITLIFYSINKQRWMVWENDRYVEVSFNTELYNLGRLKLYNEDRIKYFRKVPVNCSTEFFDTNNKVKIWYGKNNKKELEFFTSLGLHPETGKTLNPITNYMINKYACPK